jgi:hypothetical protein
MGAGCVRPWSLEFVDMLRKEGALDLVILGIETVDGRDQIIPK